MKKILNSHWQSGCLPVIIEDHGNSVEKYMHIFFSSLPPGTFQWPITSSPKLPIILNYLYFQISSLFSWLLILTHPVNFPCGRKLENPEKTHDFQQCWRTLPTCDEMFDTILNVYYFCLLFFLSYIQINIIGEVGNHRIKHVPGIDDISFTNDTCPQMPGKLQSLKYIYTYPMSYFVDKKNKCILINNSYIFQPIKVEALGHMHTYCSRSLTETRLTRVNFFLHICNANLGKKDIAGSCRILDIYASCCGTCNVIILQTKNVTGGDFSWLVRQRLQQRRECVQI